MIGGWVFMMGLLKSGFGCWQTKSSTKEREITVISKKWTIHIHTQLKCDRVTKSEVIEVSEHGPGWYSINLNCKKIFLMKNILGSLK